MDINNNFSFGREENFFDHLEQEFKKQPIKIDLIVSFIYGAGATILLKMIKNNLATSTKINILTSFYMNSTDVGGLNLLQTELLALGYDINIKIYDTTYNGFHPKAYIFTYENYSTAFIGSSNIGFNAFRKNIEWNYKITKNESVNKMIGEFNHLWNLPETQMLTEELMQEQRKKKKIANIFANKEEDALVPVVTPNELQIDILTELKKSRMNGEQKGLVVAATGTGKTYLAAFDSLKFERVLFIAHRHDILEKTRESFESIRFDKMTNFFDNERDATGNVVFATFQTLVNNLNKFNEFDFDYIVIDEAHRSEANGYKHIINHFKPQYLLGLTATPERSDNGDIYVLFDENLIYEIRLFEAINKGYLNDFEYYGIKDVTIDYKEDVGYVGKTTFFNEEKLIKELNKNERHEFIFNHYQKYQKSRTAIGFCRDIKHANSITKYFKSKGVNAKVSTSEKSDEVTSIKSDKAIKLLRENKVDIVFTVNKFNEGIDIPNVDLIINARPTDSSTIFTQQIGRGLRKQENKKRTVILDFVGNYKRLELVPQLFFNLDIRERSSGQIIKSNFEGLFPENCIINFDFGVINLFKEYNEQHVKQDFFEDIIMQNYYNSLNEETMTNFYNHPTRYNSLLELDKLPKGNEQEFFKNHIEFLRDKGMLAPEEKYLLENEEIKKIFDKMSTIGYKNSYQGIMLKTFIKNKKELHQKISIENLVKEFRQFYATSHLKSELSTSSEAYTSHDLEIKEDNFWLKKIKDGPLRGRYDFINYDKKSGDIILNISEELLTNECFVFHFTDIVKYKMETLYRSKIEENKNVRILRKN